MNKATLAFGFALLAVALVLSACAAAPQVAPTSSPVPATETAVPPTFTPVPSATNTPLPTATSTPDATATQAAKATAQADEYIQTINKIFDDHKLPAPDGSLGEFFTDSLSLDSSTYGETKTSQLSQNKYTDFAFYTEITWNSTSGLAGCGIAFHGDKDFKHGEQHRLFLLRLSGAPAWDVEYYKENKFQSVLTGKILFNKAINVGNGDKNAYLLVMHNDILSVYANGVKMKDINMTAGPKDGYIHLYTFQESGKTSCTFANSWVWNFKK